MNLKGSLPLLILHILSYGPNYGYRINKVVSNLSEDVLNFKEGTLYPTLHKLEKAGLIQSEHRKAEGRRRRVYELTEFGKTQLQTERTEWGQFKEAVDAVLEADGENISAASDN